MKRAFSILLTVLAVGAVVFEVSPAGAPVHSIFAGWMGTNSLAKRTTYVTAIDVSSEGAGIQPLDAALVLRAVLRYAPMAVVYLDAIESGDTTLLSSKLNDAKVPVVFTANENLTPLIAVTVSDALPVLPSLPAVVPAGHMAGGSAPSAIDQVRIVARQGSQAVPSNILQLGLALGGSTESISGRVPGWLHCAATIVPVDAMGCADINPIAARFVQRINLSQLLLRTERSEQGSIGLDLDRLFRGRMVAVQKKNQAIGLAALQNRLADAATPYYVNGIAILLAAMLSWWVFGCNHRALLAVSVSCAWALLALSIYQAFRVIVPMSWAVVLPLLAWIPIQGSTPIK